MEHPKTLPQLQNLIIYLYNYNPIKDGKIVSAIRNRLAEKIDIKELQKILYGKWQDKISNKDLCLTDATCYESFLRFPTDVKLL